MRQDLKPIEILQPEGPSFTVAGNQVEWQKWKFRVGFTGKAETLRAGKFALQMLVDMRVKDGRSVPLLPALISSASQGE